MKKIRIISLVLAMVLMMPYISIAAITPRTIIVQETTENNDSFNDAQDVLSGYIIYGYVSNANDVDCYKVTLASDRGLSFNLNHANDGRRYNIDIYWAEADYYGEYYDSATSTNGIVSMPCGPASAGQSFFVCVSSYTGYSSTSPYELQVVVDRETSYPNAPAPGYAYYGQTAPSTTTDYVLNFNKIYDADCENPNKDYEQWNWYTNLSKFGCYACSFAMVLNNLNEYTKRQIPNVMAASGANITSEYMIAQPYTILWANTTSLNNAYTLESIGTSFTYNSNDNTYYTDDDAYDMCVTDRRATAVLFDVTIIDYDISGLSATNKKNVLANMIADNPEGVIAIFNNSAKGEHAIVFTDTEYEAANMSYEQYVSSVVSKHGKFDDFDELNEYHLYSSYSSRSSNNDYSKVNGEKGTYHTDNVQASRSATQVFSDGDMFTTYDPGRYTNENGVKVYCEGVSLNETYTANHYYSGWTDLRSVIIIEPSCCY